MATTRGMMGGMPRTGLRYAAGPRQGTHGFWPADATAGPAAWCARYRTARLAPSGVAAELGIPSGIWDRGCDARRRESRRPLIARRDGQLLAAVRRRWDALRDLAIAAGGRPGTVSFAGYHLSFPVLHVAVAVGVATAGLPYLARGV